MSENRAGPDGPRRIPTPELIIYNVGMAEQLLQTKLYIPPLRPDHVPRPHLVRQIREGQRKSHTLILISAPAGYGKTTIMTEYLRGRQIPAAWLFLDKEDNAPARFFAYLFASLRNIDQETSKRLNQHLERVQSLSPVSMMAALINEIDSLNAGATRKPEASSVVVLDDYHTITDPALHESVDFLLERMPAGMQLGILTRQDPPLSLSRLRGRGLITELRQDDLRFSYDESARFLKEVMGLAPSQQEIEILNDRSEGWAAGMQMAALSMRGLDEGGRAQFIAGFSGRQRFVLDYLTDEVLERQPPYVREFLLKTSILERMCADLCRIVLAKDGQSETTARIQEVLEYMESSNLFLVPLDDRRNWYRYHQLFAELLQARLRESDPDLVPALHERAAAWYEKQGMAAQAIHHQLLSGDMNLAADRIARAIKDFETWSKVEVITFLDWLEALPDDVIADRPWLMLFSARSYFVAGETAKATRVQDRLETWLDSQPSSKEITRLQGLVRADRASYALVSGNIGQGIDYAQRALEELPEDDRIGRMRATALLGLAYHRRGDPSGAADYFSDAIEMATVAKLSYGVVPLICNLAEVYFLQGKLGLVLRESERAIHLGTVEGSPIAATGFAFLERGKVRYERNDLAAAAGDFDQALELLSQGGIARSFGNVHSWQALSLQAQGKPSEALAAAQEAVRIADEEGIERISLTARAYQARIWLAQEATGRAVQWADEYVRIEPAEYLRELEDITLAMVFLAADQLDDAGDLLERLDEQAVNAGRMNSAVQIAILQALAAGSRGEEVAALRILQRAVELAEAEGFCRSFLDRGLPMARLLRMGLGSSQLPGYGRRLLQAFSGEAVQVQAGDQLLPDQGRRRSPYLVESLTDRELEVLALLAEGLANKDIARRLFLSPNTVRSHTYNIYGKLDVHSRTQAVARARELDLLPEE